MSLIINWNDFTPISALIGGALIGISSVVLLAARGRILGISGIVGSLLQRANTPPDHYLWRILFICGILLAAVIGNIFNLIPKLDIRSDYSTLIIGGLLVGLAQEWAQGVQVATPCAGSVDSPLAPFLQLSHLWQAVF